MNIAAYPGSFDPITKGHLDIIERASKIVDELVVVIMENPVKKYMFTEQERLAMIQQCVKQYPNVKVVIGSGLTVDFAQSIGAKVLIRGIRAVSDYEYELQQASANQTLNPSIETLFMVSRPEYSFLSSSIAKQIAMYDGNVDACIPEVISDLFWNKVKQLRKDN